MAALGKRGLFLRPTNVTDLAGYAAIETLSFAGWGALGEEQATAALHKHFSEHFCLPTGTHVEDVHGVEPFLSCDVAYTDTQGRKVVMHFPGKTDLIATDSGCVGDVMLAAAAALCLIELKTAEALRAKRAACRAQAILQLISIEMMCGYAVPVVLSNLMVPSEDGSGIHVFSREGRIIREFVGAGGKSLTLAEANGVLAALLPAVRAQRARIDSVLLMAAVGDRDDDKDEGDRRRRGGHQ